MMNLQLTTDNIAGDLDFIKTSHKTVLIQKEATGIRRWLRVDGLESEARYQEALSQRHIATGLWILNSTSFLEWLGDTSSCLWLYGIGKVFQLNYNKNKFAE
jgi:hypothetical protein